MSAHGPEEGKLARLLADAEQEMRRKLPDGNDGAPGAKRRKGGGGGGAADAAEAAAAAGGRFDYGAIKELATGITGFILTCPLQRENSARKEAGHLLQRYLKQCSSSTVPGGAETPSASEAGAEAEAGAEEAGPRLAAVKMACRGLVAFKHSAQAAGHAADASSSSSDTAAASLVQRACGALLADIDSGKQPRLHHVQRVIPVQTTCRVQREALQAAGGWLAGLVATDSPLASTIAVAEGSQPRTVRFGIFLKQREASGVKADAAEAGMPALPEPEAAESPEAAANAALEAAPPLDRGAIIASLAAGFEHGLRGHHGLQAAVDLKAPDYVLIAEVVPAAGDLYAALCVLPSALCLLKPKLHIKPVGKL